VRHAPVLRRHAFALALLAGAVGARVAAARGTLLYPDGYQYLLMARGISAHLRPVIELGHGGDLFVPSADAAAKPLYPGAIALLHLLGFGWRGAATTVSAVSAGVAVGLVGILASRLTGSRVAGAAAAVLLLVSPAARQWSSYAVPDPFAQGLALGAVLAVVDRRFRVGGVLAGLALFARPELGLLLLLGAGAFTLRARGRTPALRFATAGALTAAVVLLVLRPPLELAPSAPHVALALVAALVVVGAVLAPPRIATGAGVAALVAAGVVAPSVSSLATGAELPLLLLAAAGLATAASRTRALVVVAAGSLALLYAWKNPDSGRYAANLLPLAAVAAGFAVAAMPRRGLALAAATAAACIGAIAPTGPLPAQDSFTTVAGELPRTRTPLVTAAADAYGFLLYPRPVRWLRPGSHGAVLLDGAARAYEPTETARGRVVARLDAGAGFLRPDGRVDRLPALLVDR
jgi:hypothetical protein